MSINSQNRTNMLVPGVGLGVVGMSAYYLPVTKNRFVRTAFNIQKELTEDKIELLNETAMQINKKKLSPENKLFLSQEGLAEDVNAINQKCIDLRKSITDSDIVKNFKKGFEDNFKDFKKSEAMMDNIASKAFQRIRWANFGWGVGIGFLIGSSLGSLSNKS